MTIQTWHPRLLYAILIGKRDKGSREIRQELIEDVLVDLFENLKEAAGGITHMQPFEAVGDTSAWGKEPSTVVLILAQPVLEEKLDSTISGQGHWIAKVLSQDQVWITKQRLELYVAQPPQ